MAISFDRLPYDENGIPQGAWRVLHKDPAFTGDLGPAIFSQGVSVFPVAGRPLRLLAAHFGGDLYIEPWGDAPTNGWMLPPCVLHDVPEGIDFTPEPCPWRQPAAPVLADTEPPPAPVEDDEEPALTHAAPHVAPVDADGLDALDKDALQAFADECEIEYDGRWGEARLRAEIRSAMDAS